MISAVDMGDPRSDDGRLCVVAGSFDPPTMGHLDIITRARRMFDTVTVAVVHNPNKPGLFTYDQRAELLRECLRHDDDIRVDVITGGLLADYCARVKAVALVRGVRTGVDLDYERQHAGMNAHLAKVDTVFLLANPVFEHLSSSLVKEVARLGADITGMVPEPVRAAMPAALASVATTAQETRNP